MRRIGRVAVVLAALAGAAGRSAAQVVAVTPSQRIAVAHDGVLELYSPDGQSRLWKSDGVSYAAVIVTGPHEIAVLDPLANRVRIANAADGSGRTITTSDTPIAAVFVDDDLYVVERDARRLERIAADGTRSSVDTGAYPEIVCVANGKLYVYARGDGLLQEIAPHPLAVLRTVAVKPFASDFETDGTYAYFVYPEEGRLRATRLETLAPAGETRVGDAPVDLAIAPSTPLSAAMLALADPAAKRVWMIEAPQSTATAFGRGFLRGLLGLGLFGGRTTAFSSGVDRVTIGKHQLAFDSSSGTLYAFSKKKSEQLATGLAARAWVPTPDGVALWNGALVTRKLD